MTRYISYTGLLVLVFVLLHFVRRSAAVALRAVGF